jgi:hypothetical protein
MQFAAKAPTGFRRVIAWGICAGVIIGVGLPTIGASQANDSVRIVTSGVILKIDAKKKTFQFRITLDAFPRGFGGYGGRGRNGGRGGPFPRSRGSVNPQGIPVVDVKVYVSQKTTLKSQGEGLVFAALRVGDRISLTGVHKGKGTDIDAIEIDRSESR